MITPGYNLTATERVLPRLALDFTTAITDSRVNTARAGNTATRFNENGVLEIVNANIARYTYDPTTLVCQGQLIEETRTNLFLNSLIDGTNLATQSVTLSATSYMLSFYGTGSVVISGGHSATVDGAGAFPTRKTYAFTPTAGSSTFTVTGDVKFAQLEAGTFSTSFIPTAASSVLRNADAVSMTGTNFSDWYNATEGTFAARGTRFATGLVTNILGVSDGTTTNRIRLYQETNNRMTINTSVLGSTTTGNGAATYGVAAAYSANGVGVSCNGGTVAVSAAGAVPTGITSMDIGRNSPASTVTLNGWLQSIRYWPQRLTNAELQAFSK